MGASTLANAYPERLGVELGKRFPKTKFEMTNLSRRGQPAAEMAGRFASEVESHHPALVIWQTGTVDAVREAFAHPTGGFHVVTFAPGQGVRRIVLDVQEAKDADKSIHEKYHL